MSLRVALVSALLLVAIAASLAVFWTGALVGTKNADATSESNHIILSFDLQGDLGNLDDGVGGLGNNNITVNLSNGRTFEFDGISTAPGSASLVTGGDITTPSLVLSDPEALRRHPEEGQSQSMARMSPSGSAPRSPLFRAAINDFENGMMYEFMPDLETGKMVVIGRSHDDLQESIDRPVAEENPVSRRLLSRGPQSLRSQTPREKGAKGKGIVGKGNMAPRQLEHNNNKNKNNRNNNDNINNNNKIINNRAEIMARPDGDFFDLMVVWTLWAECANATPGKQTVDFPCETNNYTEQAMRATIDLTVQMSNQVLALSGISTRLRLVHAYRHENPRFENPVGGYITLDDALEDITVDRTLHANRLRYGADAVSMFIYNPIYGYCGTAWKGEGGPNKAEKMLSVVDYRCATSRYDLLHELSHNLGAEHDRGTTNQCDVKNVSQYGYRHPQYPYRTVMAYDCNGFERQCDNNPFRGNGCWLLPVLSGPQSTFMVRDASGRPVPITMGDYENNNAWFIGQAMRKVRSYR